MGFLSKYLINLGVLIDFPNSWLSGVVEQWDEREKVEHAMVQTRGKDMKKPAIAIIQHLGIKKME